MRTKKKKYIGFNYFRIGTIFFFVLFPIEQTPKKKKKKETNVIKKIKKIEDQKKKKISVKESFENNRTV